MRLEIHPAYVTTLPSGLTVGDEFRIAGRVRVVAIAEDEVETFRFTDERQQPLSPAASDLTVTVRLLDVVKEEE